MIEIRPERGFRGDVETDAGIDGVYLIDATTSKTGRFIAVLHRDPGSPVQFVERGLAPAIVKEAKAAADKRDGLKWSARKVEEPPDMRELPEDDDFE